MSNLLNKIRPRHIILALLLLWGGFLRLYHLGDQSLWIDESYTALAINRIVETGLPILRSGAAYWRGFTYNYPAAGLQWLFGKEEWALRLPAALWGIGMIGLIYWSGVTFFKNRLIGLVAAALITFGYYDIAWSRQIRMYTEFQFLFLLSITLYYTLIRAKTLSIWKWGLALLVTFLTLATHLLGALLLPAYIIMMGLKGLIRKYWLFGIAISAVLAGVVLNWISFSGFLIDTLYHPKFHLSNYLAFLVTRYPLVVIGSIVGIYYAIRLKNQTAKRLGILFLIILITLGLTDKIAMRYLFFALPLLTLLTAYGVAHFLKSGQMFWGRVLTVFILWAVSFQFSFAATPQIHTFLEFDPISQNPKLDYTPQPDFKKAYEFLENRSGDGQIFIVAHTGIHEWYKPDSKYYWFGFHFGNDPGKPNNAIVENEGSLVDIYTGVGIVDDLNILKELIANNHGYVIWDYFATDNRLSKSMQTLLQSTLPLIFHHQAHPDLPWTQLWIYQF